MTPTNPPAPPIHARDQGFDAEEENLLAEIIHKYDKSGSGSLEMSEVEQFLREAGGVPPTPAELRWVVHMATPRQRQEQLQAEDRESRLQRVELRIDDLRGAARAWSCYLQKSALINTIFNMYDKDTNEELDREELAEFIRDYLEKMRLEQTALTHQLDPGDKIERTHYGNIEQMGTDFHSNILQTGSTR